MLNDFLVFSHVIAAGLFAAFSTFQVVSGIDNSASRAGIVSPDFPEPLFIPNSLDSLEVDP
jgi:hypothetical protein